MNSYPSSLKREKTELIFYNMMRESEKGQWGCPLTSGLRSPGVAKSWCVSEQKETQQRLY